MSGFSRFEKEKITMDIVDLNEFEFIWCIEDPIDEIDSLTDFDDLDMEKLLAKERAFLDSL